MIPAKVIVGKVQIANQIPNMLAQQYVDKELTKLEVESQGPTGWKGTLWAPKSN